MEAHWSPVSDKFREPVPPEDTKAAIRRLLPSGLSDPESKIRSVVVGVSDARCLTYHWCVLSSELDVGLRHIVPCLLGLARAMAGAI